MPRHGHFAADGGPLRLDVQVPHLDGRVRAPARHPVALQVEAPHFSRVTGQRHDGPGAGGQFDQIKLPKMVTGYIKRTYVTTT